MDSTINTTIQAKGMFPEDPSNVAEVSDFNL